MKPSAGTPSAIQLAVGLLAQGSVTAGKEIPDPPYKEPTVGALNEVEALPRTNSSSVGRYCTPAFQLEVLPNVS